MRKLKRKEESIPNRLRIGHARLAHGYLMAKEEPAACVVSGGVQLTVKHIIAECLRYEQDRQLIIGLDTTGTQNRREDNKMIQLFLKATRL